MTLQSASLTDSTAVTLTHGLIFVATLEPAPAGPPGERSLPSLAGFLLLGGDVFDVYLAERMRRART